MNRYLLAGIILLLALVLALAGIWLLHVTVAYKLIYSSVTLLFWSLIQATTKGGNYD